MSLCTWNSFNFFVWFGGFLFQWKLLMYGFYVDSQVSVWYMRLAFRRKLTNSLLMKSMKMEDWRNVCKLTKSLLMKSMKMEGLKKMWKLWKFVLAVCLLCLKSCQCFWRRGVQCTLYNYKLSVELVGAWTSRASTKRFFMLFLKINTTVNCHL